MESITQAFKCVICLGNVRDARMCPSCSKMCCFECVDRWLQLQQTSQCPHCRHIISVESLVNCRWADEIVDQLDELVNTSMASGEDGDQCPEHKKTFTVYCGSCDICICYPCAIWGSHIGHATRELDVVYDERVAVVSKNVLQLRARQKELLFCMQEIEKRVEILRRARDDQCVELRCEYEAAMSEIDSQLRVHLTEFLERRNGLTGEAKRLEELLLRIEHDMTASAKHRLINSSKDLMAMFSSISMTSMPDLPAVEPFRFSHSEVRPSYLHSKVVISQIDDLIARPPLEPVYSEVLSVDGLRWRAKVYPCGTQAGTGSHISVFLELIGAVGSPKSRRKQSYQWRVEMRQMDQRSSPISREHVDDFVIGECWGYEKFFRIDKLRSEGFVSDASPNLTISFSVRPSSFHVKASDQARYIKHLEEFVAQQHVDLQSSSQKSDVPRTSAFVPQTSKVRSEGHSQSLAFTPSSNTHALNLSTDPPPQLHQMSLLNSTTSTAQHSTTSGGNEKPALKPNSRQSSTPALPLATPAPGLSSSLSSSTASISTVPLLSSSVPVPSNSSGGATTTAFTATSVTFSRVSNMLAASSSHPTPSTNSISSTNPNTQSNPNPNPNPNSNPNPNISSNPNPSSNSNPNPNPNPNFPANPNPNSGHNSSQSSLSEAVQRKSGSSNTHSHNPFMSPRSQSITPIPATPTPSATSTTTTLAMALRSSYSSENMLANTRDSRSTVDTCFGAVPEPTATTSSSRAPPIFPSSNAQQGMALKSTPPLPNSSAFRGRPPSAVRLTPVRFLQYSPVHLLHNSKEEVPKMNQTKTPSQLTSLTEDDGIHLASGKPVFFDDELRALSDVDGLLRQSGELSLDDVLALSNDDRM